MRLREQYNKLIEKKRSEIEGLRTQLTAAEAYVLGLQDAIKLLDKGSSGEGTSAPFQLREGSNLAKVRELLLQEGKPLKINDILSKLGTKVTTETRTALSGSLGQYARQQRVFTKTGVNEFGLLELEYTANPVEDEITPDPFQPYNDAQSAGISDDDIPF